MNEKVQYISTERLLELGNQLQSILAELLTAVNAPAKEKKEKKTIRKVAKYMNKLERKK